MTVVSTKLWQCFAQVHRQQGQSNRVHRLTNTHFTIWTRLEIPEAWSALSYPFTVWHVWHVYQEWVCIRTISCSQVKLSIQVCSTEVCVCVDMDSFCFSACCKLNKVSIPPPSPDQKVTSDWNESCHNYGSTMPFKLKKCWYYAIWRPVNQYYWECVLASLIILLTLATVYPHRWLWSI